MQLKEVVENDRKAKQDHSSKPEPGPVESENNLISKFFTRPKHEAYARRAKQDIVQKYIESKFVTEAKQINGLPVNEVKQPDLKDKKRSKEIEVKKALDEQILKKQ